MLTIFYNYLTSANILKLQEIALCQTQYFLTEPVVNVVSSGVFFGGRLLHVLSDFSTHFLNNNCDLYMYKYVSGLTTLTDLL